MEICVKEGDVRTVEDLRIAYHTSPDENGVAKEHKFVAFIIIGKQRKWENWIPYDEFRKLNSGMEI